MFKKTLLKVMIVVLALSGMLMGVMPTAFAAKPAEKEKWMGVSDGDVRLLVVYTDDLPDGQRKKLLIEESLKSESQFDEFPIGTLVVKASKADKVIEKLEKKKGVVSVERDEVVKAAYEPSTEWDMSQLNAPNAWTAGLKGEGVKIGVLDSGLNPHPDISESRIKKRWSVYTYSPANLGYDDSGHGTHVVGTIASAHNGTGVKGVAPNADIYSYRVLNEEGSGLISHIVRGIEEAIKDRVDVLNMSLGGEADSDGLRVAYAIAARKYGILIAKAVGNEGTSDSSQSNVDPTVTAYGNSNGDNADVIGVAAVDRNNQRGTFSSTGAGIDLSSYGVGILSTTKDGGYEAWNGTSMATPHVAGLFALYHQAYGDNVEYREMLKNTQLLGEARQYGNGLAKAPTSDTNIRVTWAVQSQWQDNIYDMRTDGNKYGITFFVKDKYGNPLPGYTVEALAYVWMGKDGDDLFWQGYDAQYTSYYYDLVGKFHTGTTRSPDGVANVWFYPSSNIVNPNRIRKGFDEYRVKLRVTSPTGQTYEDEVQFKAIKSDPA